MLEFQRNRLFRLKIHTLNTYKNYTSSQYLYLYEDCKKEGMEDEIPPLLSCHY